MKEKLGQETLCLFIKRKKDKISHVCLAKKARGFGEGKWNGFGGKMDEQKDQSILDAAMRELREEAGDIKISVTDINKVAEVNFRWPEKVEWNKVMHVYLIENWEGEIKGSEEMIEPTWYLIDELSDLNMWDADRKWLSLLFDDKKAQVKCLYDNEGKLIEWEYELAEF